MVSVTQLLTNVPILPSHLEVTKPEGQTYCPKNQHVQSRNVPVLIVYCERDRSRTISEIRASPEMRLNS